MNDLSKCAVNSIVRIGGSVYVKYPHDKWKGLWNGEPTTSLTTASLKVYLQGENPSDIEYFLVTPRPQVGDVLTTTEELQALPWGTALLIDDGGYRYPGIVDGIHRGLTYSSEGFCELELNYGATATILYIPEETK